MSQSQVQTQTQSPYVHDIHGCIKKDGTVHCHHGKVPLLTSFTPKNPRRQFFTCNLRDENKCAFFVWLDRLREEEDWDENLFRAAYPQYRPPEDNLAAPEPETPRKRRTSPGPSVPPKRICRAQPDSDEEFFTSPPTSMNRATSQLHSTANRTFTTPSREDPRSTRTWPLTPSSPSTREPQPVVGNASPSQEVVRRHETRVSAQLSYLQNFDGIADLSPLSLTPTSQAIQSLPARTVASVDEVEEIINITNNITVDYVRKLERRSIASQKASDAKRARIQQLEAELESSHREYERSQQQINKLNRENERFQQEIIMLTDKLRNRESNRLSRFHPA